MSSVRHVQVGSRWESPPPANGLDPDACASLGEWRDVLLRLAEAAPADRAPTLQQVAVRGFRGVSPQLVRDLAAAAGVPDGAVPATLAPEQWQQLWEAWQGWLARLASGTYAASTCPDSGAYSLLGTQPQPVPALLPFLHTYYSVEQQEEQFAAVKAQLVRTVASAIARLQVGGPGQPGPDVPARRQLACGGLPLAACCSRLGLPLTLLFRCQHLTPPPSCPSLAAPQKKVESLQRQGGEGDRHAATQKQADLIMSNVYRWVAGWEGGGGAGHERPAGCRGQDGGR